MRHLAGSSASCRRAVGLTLSRYGVRGDQRSISSNGTSGSFGPIHIAEDGVYYDLSTTVCPLVLLQGYNHAIYASRSRHNQNLLPMDVISF
jgi:hypothetical protein